MGGSASYLWSSSHKYNHDYDYNNIIYNYRNSIYNYRNSIYNHDSSIVPIINPKIMKRGEFYGHLPNEIISRDGFYLFKAFDDNEI